MMGADYHHVHHIYNWYNFGLFTCLWDTLCGTIRHPTKTDLTSELAIAASNPVYGVDKDGDLTSHGRSNNHEDSVAVANHNNKRSGKKAN
jgi:hypothetical protein